MRKRTPTQRALEVVLGDVTLDDFVLNRRAAGISWRRVVSDLETATGIDVSIETMRSWYLKADQDQAERIVAQLNARDAKRAAS